MVIAYYPGCTAKSNARNLEISTLAVAKALAIDIKEVPSWTCCGTVYSLATDNLMNMVAPIRNLLKVQEMGADRVFTLCSMCWNTLKRVNEYVRANPDKLETINLFMDDEEDYRAEVEVVHFMEVLRDEIGFENLATKVVKPLRDLKLVPYYGCLLVRPEEIALDDRENPLIMDDLLRSLGAEVINDPMKTECCGSYQTVTEKEAVAERTYRIISSAVRRGGDALALTCPLCRFNLDSRQADTESYYPGFQKLPVFYFTQLLALAVGLSKEECGLDLHYVDPVSLLESKKFFKSIGLKAKV
ncbi:MAG: CoB--CoM heterodisulfide reductase iron-sulfur subunit B family protein [Promethearchaeota archaeon]